MKTAITIVMALAFTLVLGCQSPRGGGVSGGEGFTIGTPTFDTTLKQGETQSVTVSLKRGEHFKRDVWLEMRFSEGISVNPTSALVRGSDSPDVQLQVAAARDANFGEYRVHIKGTPDTGEATSTEFKVKVVAP